MVSHIHLKKIVEKSSELTLKKHALFFDTVQAEMDPSNMYRLSGKNADFRITRDRIL